MVGALFFAFTIMIFIFIFFLKISYFLSYILDVILVAGGVGYLSYIYLVPLFSSDEAKWFWVIFFAILSAVIYGLIYIFIVLKFEKIGKLINFIISLIGATVYLTGMKLLFDSLYTSFYIKQKEGIVHFTFFKNNIFDYVLYLIVIIFYTYVIYYSRKELQEDLFG